MVKCTVKSCVSRSENDNKASGVSFHKLPQDQKRKEKWIKNIRLLRKETNWLPSGSTVICSKHFSDRDKIAPKHDKGHIRLSEKAVPMVIHDETVTPLEMEVDLNVESDEEIDEILETPREHKIRKIIERLRFVSSNRLKCIKKLRQKNRRLEIKNKKLTKIIKKVLLK